MQEVLFRKVCKIVTIVTDLFLKVRVINLTVIDPKDLCSSGRRVSNFAFISSGDEILCYARVNRVSKGIFADVYIMGSQTEHENSVYLCQVEDGDD